MATAFDELADDVLARSCAADIRDGFADYNARFRSITQRARRRFEARDWVGARADAVERIELYNVCVAETEARLAARLGPRSADKGLWSAIRRHYEELIGPLLDRELNKTFFNTLTRRSFKTRGVDAAIEFVALDIEPTDRITHPVGRHSYAVSGDLQRTLRRVLDGYAFDLPYEHPGVCTRRMADELLRRFRTHGAVPVRNLELLETVFYREHRAYLVGRLFGEGWFAPIVVALMHDEGGSRQATA